MYDVLGESMQESLRLLAKLREAQCEQEVLRQGGLLWLFCLRFAYRGQPIGWHLSGPAMTLLDDIIDRAILLGRFGLMGELELIEQRDHFSTHQIMLNFLRLHRSAVLPRDLNVDESDLTGLVTAMQISYGKSRRIFNVQEASRLILKWLSREHRSALLQDLKTVPLVDAANRFFRRLLEEVKQLATAEELAIWVGNYSFCFFLSHAIDCQCELAFAEAALGSERYGQTFRWYADSFRFHRPNLDSTHQRHKHL